MLLNAEINAKESEIADLNGQLQVRQTCGHSLYSPLSNARPADV